MKIQPLQFIDVSKQFERCFEDRCTLQGCAWVYFNMFTGRMKPIIHSSVPLTDRLNGFRWNGIKHVIGTNIILYYRNTMQYFKRKVNHHVRGKTSRYLSGYKDFLITYLIANNPHPKTCNVCFPKYSQQAKWCSNISHARYPLRCLSITWISPLSLNHFV